MQYFYSKEAASPVVILYGLIEIGGVVVDLSDGNQLKFFAEVVVVHEKYAII